GVLRGQALAGVAKGWAESDGAAALAWAQALPEGEARDAALKGALIVLAKEGAKSAGAAALAGAQALPEGEARDAALKGALIGWAKYDPGAALSHLDLVPPGAEEMYYASDVGAQVLSAAAKRDWDGTVAWLRDHPGKLGRSSLDGLQNALSQRLNADPA